jgi:Zn-dependent protease
LTVTVLHHPLEQRAELVPVLFGHVCPSGPQPEYAGARKALQLLAHPLSWRAGGRMESTTQGSFPLFRLAGVQVYLHWSWFPVVVLLVHFTAKDYQVRAWAAAQCVALFGIVLMHEFGHALACRSVGGRADRIVLWPLGGIAFVSPPPRPGPVLWSIVAGPLVNVLLLPVTLALLAYGTADGLDTLGRFGAGDLPDRDRFLARLAEINIILLAFNLLPVYPLDGGQILQSLLWFGIGRWRSLQVVSVIGLAFGGLGLLFALVLTTRNASGIWLCILAGFVLLRSFAGLHFARHVLHMQSLPRHTDAVCPTCGIGGPRGTFWLCEHCQTRFDTFVTRGSCPACGAWYHPTTCPHCGQAHRVEEWYAAAVGQVSNLPSQTRQVENLPHEEPGAHAPRSPH